MKRLFIEVQYDEEAGEVTDVLMDKEWESINPMERCDVYDYLSRVCVEAIDYEYEVMDKKKPKLVRVK